MSAENSVARGGRGIEPQVGAAEFGIPPDVSERYEVRAVDGSGGEQSLGLFRPGQRDMPVIEIADRGSASRIVARSEDAETVQALVKIAQHNGWDRIDVDGSPEFRKAVWAAATRQGLEVSGYEPSFVEQERLAKARAGREAAERPAAAAQLEPEASSPGGPSGTQGQPANTSAADRAAAIERGTEALAEVGTLLEERRDLRSQFDRSSELPDDKFSDLLEARSRNEHALRARMETVLESPAHLERLKADGRSPDDVHSSVRMGRWKEDVEEIVSRLRAREDEPESDREARAVADSTAPAGRSAEAEPPVVREERVEGASTERRHESDELAELFLHGAAEKLAADPRLMGAMQAQAAMEQHIVAVYQGDPAQMASANLESRLMISDALRRGLDVSVREPTPVRQIEPIQARPEMER